MRLNPDQLGAHVRGVAKTLGGRSGGQARHPQMPASVWDDLLSPMKARSEPVNRTLRWRSGV